MANRSTGIGWSWRNDQDHARREVLSALENSGGCVVAAADELGVSKRTVYRFIERGNLWDELERVRESYQPVPDDVARARAALQSEPTNGRVHRDAEDLVRRHDPG